VTIGSADPRRWKALVVFAIAGALAALAFLKRGASVETAAPSVAGVHEVGG
jgi:hypothetical protein